jgi:hypothetical protein
MRCVYCLRDPDTGHVRYIGSTGDIVARRERHLALRGAPAGTPLATWFEELRASGKAPVFKVLTTVDGAFCRGVANFAERELIGWFALKFPNRPLLNVTCNPSPSKRNRPRNRNGRSLKI